MDECERVRASTVALAIPSQGWTGPQARRSTSGEQWPSGRPCLGIPHGLMKRLLPRTIRPEPAGKGGKSKDLPRPPSHQYPRRADPICICRIFLYTQYVSRETLVLGATPRSHFCRALGADTARKTPASLPSPNGVTSPYAVRSLRPAAMPPGIRRQRSTRGATPLATSPLSRGGKGAGG
jgi:hypothetical protein